VATIWISSKISKWPPKMCKHHCATHNITNHVSSWSSLMQDRFLSLRFPEVSWQLKPSIFYVSNMLASCARILLVQCWCWCSSNYSYVFIIDRSVHIYERKIKRDEEISLATTTECDSERLVLFFVDENMLFNNRILSSFVFTLIVQVGLIIYHRINNIGFTFPVRPTVVANSVSSYIMPKELQNAITNIKKTNRSQVTPFPHHFASRWSRSVNTAWT